MSNERWYREVCAVRMTPLAAALAGALAGAPASVLAVEPAPVQFRVERFSVVGENPFSQEEVSSYLAPFLGVQSGLERLQGAAAALEQALRDRGFLFYRVTLPPQKLDHGVIELRITALPVGSVAVEGNRYFPTANIRASLPALEPGRSPNGAALSRSLALANAHPMKKVQLTFAAAREPGRVDARATVSDQPPQQLYTWLNNTGSDTTGRTRLGVGYQHGNLFDRDHQVSLSYTTSPTETDKVRQYGMNYAMPWYAQGASLSLYGVHSTVKTGTVAEFFNVSGAGTVLGTRYTQFFAKQKRIGHQVGVSLDDKRYDNGLEFAGASLGVEVRSRPVSLAYSGSYDGETARVSWSLGWARNLPSGARNDDATYGAVRAGADAGWSAWRYAAAVDYPFRNWLLRATLDGQATSAPLISGEQFGLGGVSSVRGFEEREVSGDAGYRASVEVYSPPLAQGVRIVGFAEGGEVRLKNAQPGEIARESIASVGVGARYQWRDKLSLRLDLGHVVDGTDPARSGGTRSGDDRLHFNLMYRFY